MARMLLRKFADNPKFVKRNWTPDVDDDYKIFKDLYDEYYPELFLYLHAITEDKEEIEDVIQDAFLKLLQMNADLDRLGNVKGYLFFCARNAMFNRLRDKENHRNILKRVFDTYVPESPGMTPEEVEKLVEAAKDAIEGLPPGCKNIFLSSRIQKKTYKEIAEQNGLSVKTVEAQMGIALKKIRAAIKILFDSF